MVNPIVKNYVDAALAKLQRSGMMRFPGTLPDSMRDDSIPASGDWKGWRAIPSTVTEAELAALEEETGLLFPPLYRDFLCDRHFVELTATGINFEKHLPNEWCEVLRSAYFDAWMPERIIKVGLLPFGFEGQMDAGPVCFDTRRRTSTGDCPVVFWDHDRVRTENEVRLMFSSSAKMFECLTVIATNDLNFVCHFDDDDASQLPAKQAALAEFLSIDPEGAGGPAREYWTCWGVTPAT